MTALLIVVQLVTGVFLRFVYQPDPAGAYRSILVMQQEIPLGLFFRNLHHWGASLLVVTATLHLLRVFYTGAFYPPVRSGNWVIGMIMLLLLLLSNFTGYLLPWDQLAYWAVTVVTTLPGYLPGIGESMVEWLRGGSEVNGVTLRIFFNLHTAVLPFSLFALMLFHFWRVRRAGGVVRPPDAGRGTLPAVPHLVVREAAVASLLLAFLALTALLFNAPLQAPADPAHSPDPAKAPWYFLGIQELLLHFHPLVSAILIPFTVLLFFFLLPYLPYDERRPGVPFYSSRGRRMTRTAAVAALLLTPLFIVAGEYLLSFHSWFPTWPPLLSEGVVPLLLYLLPVAALALLMKRRHRPNTGEAVTALVTFLVVTYTLLTLTALWFRGEGMTLTWPWKP